MQAMRIKDLMPGWTSHTEEQVLSAWQLPVGIDAILRMQAADAEKVKLQRPALLDAAERAAQRGGELIDAQVLCRALRVVDHLHERIKLEGGVVLHGSLLLEHLAGAEWIIVAIGTIGDAIERLAKEQLASDPLLSLALDGYGSAAVEALATEFCSLVDEDVKRRNLTSSMPLSPGMVGWPVDVGQKQIFRLLAQARIGVQLSQSSMMSPIKTVSLALGIGADMGSGGVSPCDVCSMNERCNYRDHYSHADIN